MKKRVSIIRLVLFYIKFLYIIMQIKIERLRCDEDYKCYDRTLFLYSMQLKAKRERNKQKKNTLSMNLSY